MIKALKKTSKAGNEYFALFFIQGEVEIFLAYMTKSQYEKLALIQK